jgi:polysaccharide biosynthesis transport protein
VPEAKALLETESSLAETLGWILRILRTRKLLILGTAAAIAVATAAVLPLIPQKYTSEAMVLVVKQAVPERYVIPTSSTAIGEELEAMSEEVLSRSRLMGIVDDLGLYSKQRARLAPEQIIEKMRKRIDVTPFTTPDRKDFSAFKITFSAEDPQTAQQVTSRLTSLFIAENQKTRQDQAANTASFLSTQLDAVKDKLTQQEARLKDFKMQHLGELPEQQQSNLAILGALQAQLQNVVSNRGRAQQQRAYLESLLNGYRTAAARGVPVFVSAGSAGGRMPSPLEDAFVELRRLQAKKAALVDTLTPEHPDVVKVEAEIKRQERVVESLKPKEAPAQVAAAASATASAPSAPATGGEDDVSISQLKSQIEANRLEIEDLLKDEHKVQGQIADYQKRLNATPVREQQLADVVRDYELLKLNYADLLSKKQQSQLAASLEKEEEGQHFRVIDPASLPRIPSGPPPILISLGGAGAGLLIGVAMAFLLEMRKNAFQSEKDVMRSMGLVLVLEVPVLLTTSEERSRSWKAAFGAVMGCVLGLVICATEYYVYRHG